MGNLRYNEDIDGAWENIKDNIKTSAKGSLNLHELKQHKPLFDEECFLFFDRREQAKLQWLENRNQSSVNNLNKVGG